MKLDTIRLYDIGTDVKGYDAEALKSIEWPINAWECLIPDNATPSSINILLKLILNIVDQQIYTTTTSLTRFLTESLQLHPELIKNVLADCQSQFFDNRFKNELHLTENATKMLYAANGNISPDMDMASTHHKIYLLQDCITKTVFPCFDMKALPKAYESIFKTKKAITLDYDFTNYRQPTTEALNTALRLWGKMQATADPDSYESESFNINSDNSEAIETMESARQKEQKDISAITIISDIPKHFYLRAFVRFDYDSPDELSIHSPLGKPYDDWFRKLFVKVVSSQPDISSQLQSFIENRKLYFKDKIALGEDRRYTLFNEYPAFFNLEAIKQLKEDVKSLYQDHFNIQSNMGNIVDFRTHIRVASEKTLKAFKLLITDITKYTTLQETEYNKILRSYFKNTAYEDDLIDKYIKKKKVFDNYTSYSNKSKDGNTKDILAHILIYGNLKNYTPVKKLFEENTELFIKMYEFANEGNKKLHSLEYMPEKNKAIAEQEFKDFEDYFRALYTCFKEVIRL